MGIGRRSFIAGLGAATVTSCQSGEAGRNLALFDHVWSTVDRHYFDPALGGLDWRAIRREWRPRAAAASTEAELYLDVLFPVLDQFRTSHVVLTPPGNLTLSNGRGFRIPRQKKGRSVFMITAADEAGMGAVLTWTGTAYVVEDVVVAGPAYAAGLRPGQLLQFAGFGGPDQRHELRLVGPVGERFTVRWAPGQPLLPNEAKHSEGGATYVRFNGFDRASVGWAADVLLGSSGPVVLDLRRNSGGLLVECWRFLSAVLPEHSDLGRFKGRKRDYPMRAGPRADKFTGGLAVLIGPRTASAAEVTAAALQHHGRARLFGSETSGSVLASQIYGLPDGGKLLLPYADYFTPAGSRIEGRGVTPDVFSVRSAASTEARSDPAVEAAVDWLRREQ